MREAVLDASVVLKWFAPSSEPGAGQAVRLRRSYRDGRLAVTVPSMLQLEVINVAGRRWSWDLERLIELALSLEDLGFEVGEPDLDGVARWTAEGLTAYDAAYVALAESRRLPLVTDDERILGVARSAIALRSLAAVDD